MKDDVQVTIVEIDDHLQAKPKSCLLRIPALPLIRNYHTHNHHVLVHRPSVPLWRVAISVALLFTNYFLAQYDKFILSYFQSDLTTSLSMTLSEYGILSGYATGIVYALLTLPVAYWADYTGYRVWLLSASAVWWSICVIFQGLSHNFWQILLARIGMGIGQAPVEALSVSLISDLVGKEWVFFVARYCPLPGHIRSLLTHHQYSLRGRLCWRSHQRADRDCVS